MERLRKDIENAIMDRQAGAPASASPVSTRVNTNDDRDKSSASVGVKGLSRSPQPAAIIDSTSNQERKTAMSEKLNAFKQSYAQRTANANVSGDSRIANNHLRSSVLGRSQVSRETDIATEERRNAKTADARTVLKDLDVATAGERAAAFNPLPKIKNVVANAITSGNVSPDWYVNFKSKYYDQRVNSPEYLGALSQQKEATEKLDYSNWVVNSLSSYQDGSMSDEDAAVMLESLYAHYPEFERAYNQAEFLKEDMPDGTRAYADKETEEYAKYIVSDTLNTILDREKGEQAKWKEQYDSANRITTEVDRLRADVDGYKNADALQSGEKQSYAQMLAAGPADQDYAQYITDNSYNRANKGSAGATWGGGTWALDLMYDGASAAEEYEIPYTGDTVQLKSMLDSSLEDSKAELEVAKRAREWYASNNALVHDTNTLADIDWRISALEDKIAVEEFTKACITDTSYVRRGAEYIRNGESTWAYGTNTSLPVYMQGKTDAQDVSTAAEARDVDLVEYATDNEKQMMAVLENENPELFKAASEALKPVLEARQMDILSGNVQTYAQQHPYLATALGIVEQFESIGEGVTAIAQGVIDPSTDIDPNSQAFASTRTFNNRMVTARQTFVDKADTSAGKAVVGALFDIGTSAISSAVVMPLGGGLGAAALSLTGFTSNLLEAAESGASKAEAFWVASGKAFSDWVTEVVPLSGGIEAVKGRQFVNALKQAIPDMLGEGLAEFGGYISEQIVAVANDSEYRSSREQLINSLILDERYTRAEANRIANKALIHNVVYSGLMGAAGSAVAFGTGALVAKGFTHNQAKKNARATLESVQEVQAEQQNAEDPAADVDAIIDAYEGIAEAAKDEALVNAHLAEVSKAGKNGMPSGPKAEARQVMAPDGDGNAPAEYDESALEIIAIAKEEDAENAQPVAYDASENAQAEAEVQPEAEGENEEAPVIEADAQSNPDEIVAVSEKVVENKNVVIAAIAERHSGKTLKETFVKIFDSTGSAESAQNAMNMLLIAESMPEATQSRESADAMLSGDAQVNEETIAGLAEMVKADMQNEGVAVAVNATLDDYAISGAVMQEVTETDALEGVKKQGVQLREARAAAYNAEAEAEAARSALNAAYEAFNTANDGSAPVAEVIAAHEAVKNAKQKYDDMVQRASDAKAKADAMYANVRREAGDILGAARERAVAARNAENSRSGGSASIGEQIVSPSISEAASPVATAGNEHQRQWGTQGAQQSAILFEDVKRRVYQNGSYAPDTNNAQVERALGTIAEIGFEEAKSRWQGLSFKEANTADNQVMGAALMAYAAATSNPTAQTDIAMRYNELGTEAGRALQARKVFDMMNPLGALAYMKRVEGKINDNYSRQGKNTRVKIPDETMQEILNAHTAEARKNAVDKAAKQIAEQMPPTWKDRFNAFRYTAMLGNPRTVIKNMLGNVGMAGMQAAKNKIAAGIESKAQSAGLINERTKTTKLRTDDVYREFARKDAEKYVPALMETGKWNKENAGDVEKHRKHFGDSAFGKALSYWEKKTGDAMEWGDKIFMTGYYARSLAGWLQANNVDMAAVSEQTLAKARDYAAKETIIAAFREESDGVKAFNQFVKKLKAGGIASKGAAMLIEGVLPFKQTPVNIVKQGIRYSPLGMVKAMTSDLIQVKNGNLSAAQMIDNLAAGLTGTVLVGVGYIMSRAGLLVGSLGDDEAWDELTGKQKYSLEYDGYSFTIDWLSPTALPMFVGAALENVMFGKDDLTVWDSLWSIAEPMMEMTMLDSLNSILSGASYAENGLVGVATDALMSYGMQYIPSFAGQLARIADVNRRTFVADPNSPVSKDVQYAVYKVASRIPGLSYLLEPYVNEWGNTQSYNTFAKGAENFVENFISPGYLSETSLDDVEEALEALNAVTVESVYPTFKKNEFTMKVEENGQYVTKTVKLSPEEYTQYKKSVGQTSHAMLEKLIATKEYNQLPSAVQVDCVKQIYEYAAKKALADARPEYVNGENLTEYMQEYLNSSNPVQAIVDKEKQDSLNAAVTNARSKAKIAISKGDYNSLGTLVAAMTTAGREDSSMRSSVTSLMKEEYHKAFLADDDEAMSMIEDVLISLDIGYKDSTFSGWRKTWYKAGEKN